MKKFVIITIIIIVSLYIFACGLLYLFQENLIFFPQKLEETHRFEFDKEFNEKNIQVEDGTVLNGLLFKSDSSKGLIFYLHGNAGSLNSWGEVAKTYTDLNYDVFMLDYRGYGKSEGVINGQNQLYEDIQTAYEELIEQYSENETIVLGYSIGTGLATKIASTNNPKRLILQAPFYSLTDMMTHTFPIIPTFILKYKFETHKYLKDCRMPVTIFHGRQDEVIYYGSSLKLKDEFKSTDKLITLVGQRHNGMTDNEDYINELKKILIKD